MENLIIYNFVFIRYLRNLTGIGRKTHLFLFLPQKGLFLEVFPVFFRIKSVRSELRFNLEEHTILQKMVQSLVFYDDY